MIEGIIKKSGHRHVKEIPLAPVLDLLTVVVFFLILSTSFTEFTKQTLPPAQTSLSASSNGPPPLSPKLFVHRQGGRLRLLLKWAGLSSGKSEQMVNEIGDENLLAVNLQKSAAELVREFKGRFNAESSIQLGLGPDVNYQALVSVMDGVRESIEDIVLISSAEEAK